MAARLFALLSKAEKYAKSGSFNIIFILEVI